MVWSGLGLGGRIGIPQKDREEATTGAVRWKMTVMRIFLVLVGATGVEEMNTPKREVRKLVNPAFGTWQEGLCNYNDTTRIQFNGVSFRLFHQDQEMKYLQAPSGREGLDAKRYLYIPLQVESGCPESQTKPCSQRS